MYSIAIIGAFSSGKSSLLNHFLGGKFAKTHLNPTTAYLTYFRNDKQRRIFKCSEQTGRYEISPQDYENEYTHLDSKRTLVSTGLHFEYYCQWSIRFDGIDVQFIDAPGFAGSSVEKQQHDEKKCEEAIAHADIILLLAEIGDGTIKNLEGFDLYDAIKLAKEKQCILILTKCEAHEEASIISVIETFKKDLPSVKFVIPYTVKSKRLSQKYSHKTCKRLLHQKIVSSIRETNQLWKKKREQLSEEFKNYAEDFLVTQRRFDNKIRELDEEILCCTDRKKWYHIKHGELQDLIFKLNKKSIAQKEQKILLQTFYNQYQDDPVKKILVFLLVIKEEESKPIPKIGLLSMFSIRSDIYKQAIQKMVADIYKQQIQKMVADIYKQQIQKMIADIYKQQIQKMIADIYKQQIQKMIAEIEKCDNKKLYDINIVQKKYVKEKNDVQKELKALKREYINKKNEYMESIKTLTQKIGDKEYGKKRKLT